MRRHVAQHRASDGTEDGFGLQLDQETARAAETGEALRRELRRE
jgi:hypothetical protein